MDKVQRNQDEDDRKKKIAELKLKLKVSKDDTRDYSKFKLDYYNKDFINNKES